MRWRWLWLWLFVLEKLKPHLKIFCFFCGFVYF